MRMPIIVITCLILGASLNAPGIGAHDPEGDVPDIPPPFGSEGNPSTDPEVIRAETLAMFENTPREMLLDVIVSLEWRYREVSKRESFFLQKSNRKSSEVSKLRNELRKCQDN